MNVVMVEQIGFKLKKPVRFAQTGL